METYVIIALVTNQKIMPPLTWSTLLNQGRRSRLISRSEPSHPAPEIWRG